MKLKLSLVSVFTLFVFASCDSSDGDSWPQEGSFEFGGNDYYIDLARETFVDMGVHYDNPPYFNFRFEGRKHTGESARSVNFYILSSDYNATHLPAGVYPVTNNSDPARSAGECIGATFYTPSEDGPRSATKGKITIEREDNMYIVRADCSFEDGYKLKLNFRGMMEYKVVKDGHDH